MKRAVTLRNVYADHTALVKRPSCLVTLGLTICILVILSGCTQPCVDQGFRGRVFEREPDGAIGPTIPGVRLTFVREDGRVTRRLTTDSAGSYRISLCTGKYYVTATHSDYEDYSSVPGFFVVTGDSYQTGNIFLREPRATTVLLVRHADRANDHLSPEGKERAKKLAQVARKAGVSAIYTTPFTRTQQTAQPLADFLKLEPIKYTVPASLVSQVLSDHDGDAVLVVGHSDTVSMIAQEFGADIPGVLLPDFDNLFVVTRRSGDAPVDVSVVNLQYGQSNPLDSVGASSYPMTTVLLVRHGEGGDAGQNRAQQLAHVARKAHQAQATAIYATAHAPTQQIVQPLADDLGLGINMYDPNDVPGFIGRLLSDHAGEAVVVAGQNATLSGIIKELGGSPIPPIFPNEYDNLFIITVYETGEAKVLNLQYGEPSP